MKRASSPCDVHAAKKQKLGSDCSPFIWKVTDVGETWGGMVAEEHFIATLAEANQKAREIFEGRNVVKNARKSEEGGGIKNQFIHETQNGCETWKYIEFGRNYTHRITVKVEEIRIRTWRQYSLPP